MNSIRMHTDYTGDNRVWSDLDEKRGLDKVIDLSDTGTYLELALVKRGTKSGKSSVLLRIDLPDGRAVIVQTTLALFASAADAFRAVPGASWQ